MTERAPPIAFHEVSKSYGGGGPVLDRVSLAVREREFLAIVGPSGSGKTTLLRLVNRLIEPSSGAVRVEGEDVSQRRRGRAAAADRLRVPGRRPVPAHDGRREHRHHAEAARLGQAAHRRARGRAARARAAPARRASRAFPAAAFRRRGAARRRRPRARGQAEDRADGRAVRRARSAHPRRARPTTTGVCTTSSA